ncbi:MAG: DUF6485 family protein [Peptococcaceae bacterium]|nr:DUF6485 family protein [Peptococcaceae bacterium]
MAEAKCNKEKNARDCACTYSGCHRRGMCCECVAYHRRNGEIPGCFFPPHLEATYDRSLRNLARSLKDLK